MRLLITLLFIFSFDTYPRGGDIIGNGGGIAESNFVHAYTRLYKLIDNCLSSDFCSRNEREFYDLLTIREATSDNFRTTSRLEFTTPDKTPGIFFTNDSDVVRLAVTGNKETDPIYVNLDILYTQKDGKSYPALSYGEIVSILIHEIGHNVKIKGDHAHLDFLGSLVRDFMEKKFVSHEYLVFDTVFNVNLMNFSQQMKVSEFWVNWEDKTKNITEEVYLNSYCRNGDKPFSIKFNNYHIEKIQSNSDQVVMPINLWGELVCLDGVVTQNEIIDMYILLKVNKKSSKADVSIELKSL